MKYYLLAGAICLMGAVAVMVSNQPEGQSASESNKDWKVYAVENETKVRPAYFEDMRYHLDAAPELRAPASKRKN
jgi:hypothetical protein